MTEIKYPTDAELENMEEIQYHTDAEMEAMYEEFIKRHPEDPWIYPF